MAPVRRRSAEVYVVATTHRHVLSTDMAQPRRVPGSSSPLTHTHFASKESTSRPLDVEIYPDISCTVCKEKWITPRFPPSVSVYHHANDIRSHYLPGRWEQPRVISNR